MPTLQLSALATLLSLPVLWGGCAKSSAPRVDGSVDASPFFDGGDAPPLNFAVFGDVRPPSADDIAGYPTEILSNIFTEIAQSKAQLVLGTGDYMFAYTAAGVMGEVPKFLASRALYPGPVYLAMGNHECNTATDSNCPALDESANVKAYMAELAPAGSTLPYFRVDQVTPSGLAKFIVLAANSWTDAQGTWLTAQLADPTAYTFVVRHESSDDSSDADVAPGVTPSDQILKGANVTITFFGHYHEYSRIDANHVISGNGGATLAKSAKFYGWLAVTQLADGDILVRSIDQASGMPNDAWTVTPQGASAP